MNITKTIFIAILMLTVGLLNGNTTTMVVCLNNNSQIKIFGSTFLAVYGNLTSNNNISGKGTLVIASSPLNNNSKLSYNNSTSPIPVCYINMNGNKISNLKVNTTVSLTGELKIAHSLEIANNYTIVLNQYNLYVNSTASVNSLNKHIVNNDIGSVIFLNTAILPQPLAHNCVTVPDIKNLVILVENTKSVRPIHEIRNGNMVKIFYSSIKPTPSTPPPKTIA